MRTQRPTSVLAITVAVTTLCVACAEPPTDAIESARDQLAAINADDANYAADQYARAQDLAQQLQTELETQEESFALTRSYDRAAELATELEAAAAGVGTAIEAEKARLSGDAERFAADAERALADARETFSDLPEDQAAELEADAAAVETSLSEARQALSRGDLNEARRVAETARSAAQRVSAAAAQVQADLERAREEEAARIARGGITLPRAVIVEGERLAPGPYQVRLTDSGAEPVEGEGPDRTRWVEFLRDGSVVARALAWVVPDTEFGELTAPNSSRPRNDLRVDELVGGEYVRLWINRDGQSYLVHLPTVSG